METLAILLAPTVIEALCVLALAVVAVTPTQADDGVVGRIVNVVRTLTAGFRR